MSDEGSRQTDRDEVFITKSGSDYWNSSLRRCATAARPNSIFRSPSAASASLDHRHALIVNPDQ